MQNQDTSTATVAQRAPYRFLTVKEVAQMVGLGVSTVWKHVKERTFPQPFNITASCTRWRDIDVMQWMDERLAKAYEPRAINKKTDGNFDGNDENQVINII